MKQDGVVVNWHQLGMQLLREQDFHYLDEIETNWPNNVRACCTEMFNKWLQTRCDACWNKLCDALIEIDLPVAAENIIKKMSRYFTTAFTCIILVS